MKRGSDDLALRRECFAAVLDDLRGNLQEEVGWAPRGLRWLVPIVALATGIVTGVALKRNLPCLRGDSPRPKRH